MNTEVKEPKVPTKEEITKFYQEQIEVATLRRDLSALLAETAKYDADRAESIVKQAHFSAPKPQNPVTEEIPEGVIHHTVTQEDLDNNPELLQQGIKVGDVIGITGAAPATEEKPPIVAEDATEDKVRKLKKD